MLGPLGGRRVQESVIENKGTPQGPAVKAQEALAAAAAAATAPGAADVAQTSGKPLQARAATMHGLLDTLEDEPEVAAEAEPATAALSVSLTGGDSKGTQAASPRGLSGPPTPTGGARAARDMVSAAKLAARDALPDRATRVTNLASQLGLSRFTSAPARAAVMKALEKLNFADVYEGGRETVAGMPMGPIRDACRDVLVQKFSGENHDFLRAAMAYRNAPSAVTLNAVKSKFLDTEMLNLQASELRSVNAAVDEALSTGKFAPELLDTAFRLVSKLANDQLALPEVVKMIEEGLPKDK